jgi:hypothetical protein
MPSKTETEGRVQLSDAEIDRRITFHDDLQAMEVDFSGISFYASSSVNRFYDRLEARIAETGHDQWFFLVNLNGTRIDSSAWIAYARRGKALNAAHSMGSVRFDASDETRAQILRAANTQAFDPNLFTSRDEAVARIGDLPSRRRTTVRHEPNHTRDELSGRIVFHDDLLVMEADFSDFTFHNARDVDDFYDLLQDRITMTGRKWFFLVNLNNCQILPGAWVRYAHRGKLLNIGGSLGSVRFAAGSETETDIRLRAESAGFRPNIRNTRAEALERIAEMRRELGG